MISFSRNGNFNPHISCSMSQALTESQVQLLLQYLYSDSCHVRREAIQHIVEHQWNDRRLWQALDELAALDEDDEVRERARGVVGKEAPV